MIPGREKVNRQGSTRLRSGKDEEGSSLQTYQMVTTDPRSSDGDRADVPPLLRNDIDWDFDQATEAGDRSRFSRG